MTKCRLPRRRNSVHAFQWQLNPLMLICRYAVRSADSLSRENRLPPTSIFWRLFPSAGRLVSLLTGSRRKRKRYCRKHARNAASSSDRSRSAAESSRRSDGFAAGHFRGRAEGGCRYPRHSVNHRSFRNLPQLLRRRPDIIAAERKLAASNARIGQALAEYYPKLDLAGFLGSEAISPGDLFRGKGFQPSAVAGLRWRLFDFGRVDAEVKQAKGANAEALIHYRASVLRATEEVEDSFSLLRSLKCVATRSASRSLRYSALGTVRKKLTWPEPLP